MVSKKDLIKQINEKLPSDGGDLDLSKLPKEQLELLYKKLLVIEESLMSGGEALVKDMVMKRAQNFGAQHLGLDDKEQNIVAKIVENRWEKGTIVGMIRDRVKKRLTGEDEKKS